MSPLTAALWALAADRRALVRALGRCARQHAPSMADPARRVVIEAAEAWAAGGPVPAVPHDLPGGLVVFTCAAAVEAPDDQLHEMVEFFARQLPTLVWMTSPAGRLWAAEQDLDTPVGQSAEARLLIAATEARLVRLVKAG